MCTPTTHEILTYLQEFSGGYVPKIVSTKLTYGNIKYSANLAPLTEQMDFDRAAMKEYN